MAPSSGATTYLYHHAVLPPQLPQADDSDNYDRDVIEAVISSLQELSSGVKDEHAKTVASAITTINNLLSIRDHDGNVSELELDAVLEELVYRPNGAIVPLEIKAQNAGVLISRCEDSVVFEFFELSPINEAAMAKGRLVRLFPRFAAKVPVSKMQQAGSRNSIACALAKMTVQAAAHAFPSHSTRNTANPGLVTDYFLNVIAALGETTDAVRIVKHTRDEVLWNNSKQPWRRSSLWLLIRVTLQLLFTRKANNAQPPDQLYKAYMVLFLSRILDLTREHWTELGSESIHATSAKIVRRLRKMKTLNDDIYHGSIWDRIRARLCEAHDFIASKWKAIQESTTANIDTSKLQTLQPENDLDMKAPCLDAFLSEISARRLRPPSCEFKPTSEYPSFPATDLPEFLDVTDEQVYFRLAATEKWVEEHLDSWAELHSQDPSTCGKLRRLIEEYHRVASTAYAGIPISMSIMFLTLLEIWVTCDVLACSAYPLLRGYDPEIHLEEFQCLCLPLRRQLERLHDAEVYVQLRRSTATKGNPSIYREFGHPSSYAVQYFDQSSALQAVMSAIERDAANKQQQKIQELANVKCAYVNLMNRYNDSECDFTEVVVYDSDNLPTTVSRHMKYCSRCDLKKRAKALKITIYEWPLSSDRSVAKATVFELKVPVIFSDWRDASVYLIANVLEFRTARPQKPRAAAHYTLDQHHELSHMLASHYQSRRIILLSESKPFTPMTKKNVINLENEQVCLKNALKYAYYDRSESVYSVELKFGGETTRKTLYRLPGRSKALERFLYKPPTAPDGLPANEPIASLTDCPGHFSMDEFKAFGVAALGRNIVWHNVLAQLAMPSLDFAKAETQSLILQITHQVGSPNEHIERATHAVLAEHSFCNAMLDQLEIALRNRSENWESWRAAATFSLIARRILSLTSAPEVVQRCHGYLSGIRETCMDWLRRLQTRIGSSTNEEQRSELHLKSTEVALLCTNTFDIEEAYFDKALAQPSTISTIMQCSIKVRENLGSMKTDPEELHDILVQSWRSLMYRLFSKLHDAILLDNQGLNDAVVASWAAFQPAPGARWISLSKPQEHWLHITSGTLTVHLSLLTAELLVDGIPLTRLPPEYTHHPSYVSLFHKLLMEVGPSSEPGMKFSAKSIYQGYKVHFGMEGDDMFVVAIGEKTRLDLLPSRLFLNLLPAAFGKDFVHWYDHSTGEVTFRPRESPWASTAESNAEVWLLTHDSCTRTWRLSKGSNVLINTASDSARVLSKLFQSLEDQSHIHIVFEATSQTVNIEIPRLQLGFYVGQIGGQIFSRQFRGMILDRDQDIGTLVGLSSKLTLKSVHLDRERLVLIPVPRTYNKDSVIYSKESSHHHVLVTINKDDVTRVYAYSLDKVLGRVLDTGDVQSKLYLSYLHALTSHCLPDNLIGCTGTEAAITILRSAAVRSFDVLNKDDIALLTLIGELSTTRMFCMQDEKTMQQVTWDEELYPLSQHPQIRIAVQEILDQARMMRLFYPGSMMVPETEELCWRPTNSQLEERDMIRSSTFRVCGYGAENFTTREDVKYDGRDSDADSERGRRAFLAATMILRDRAALHISIPDLKAALLSTHFELATIKGVSNAYDMSDLHFDAKWLCESSTLLAEHWCNLHQGLAKSSEKCNEFAIMLWLSAMAYAESADMVSIQALAAFFRIHDLAVISIPTASAFTISKGCTWNLQEIEIIVRLATKAIDQCPEGQLPKYPSETPGQHAQRVSGLFRQRQEAAIAKCIASLKSKWPTDKPSTPTSPAISPYLHMATAMVSITERFKTWNDNRRFNEYLGRLSRAMARQEVVSILTPCYWFAPPPKHGSLSNDDRYYGAKSIFVAPAPIPLHASLDENNRGPVSRPFQPEIPISEQPSQLGQNHLQTGLRSLCRCLDYIAKSACERNYVKTLRTSCDALKVYGASSKTLKVHVDDQTQALLRKYAGDCSDYLEALNVSLAEVVRDGTVFSQDIASYVSSSPRTTPTFWLSYLVRERFELLSEPWKTMIIEYGLAITHLNRAQRLVALLDAPVELAEELQHIGHSNWDPRHSSEALLLEAESGIMVREVQENIARYMRAPPDSANTVMQLNMGEGKSSVILPMTAAALSDKQSLVRVIVAKPQNQQMLHMLVSKLGGLLNRRILRMPFARHLRLSAADADAILQLCRDCVTNRSILLIQPEHILSLQLMGIEYCYMGVEAAQSVLQLQTFFTQFSRDIMDESDENFDVKFELIYTMGSQQPVDLAPQRWLIIQEVLSLLKEYSFKVKSELPLSIEVQCGGDGDYPKVRILGKDGADKLLAFLSRHIVVHGLTGLPTRNESPNMQAAIERYISHSELTQEEIQAVEDSKFWTNSTKDTLLLVRGILACGILRFTLSKRWRVNYGLDLTRNPSTLLAVPYRFKDGPSPRAEFSHPDVLIILTLLSHYYGGLSDEQLFDTFRHLLKSDQAAVQYGDWIDSASPDLPPAFKSLSGVNIKDRTLCIQQVFPYLRHSKSCIDFFLSRLVFPKEIRQFASKISSSGWDLGAIKPHPTTGFSGTKDSQPLLPLAVKHLDLPSQNHTNALVLAHLIKDNAPVDLLPPRVAGSTDAEHLLNFVIGMDPEVRVFIDCGAQILEQNNRQVAETWLRLCGNKRIQAAVFFDAEELSVLDRSGRVESFHTSPFSSKLDLCIAFLDQAHSRGIDLKFPRHYRAAVTLGAGLTKDRLMQACMRMRKLGQGQTVSFIVPEEISTTIRERVRKPLELDIELEDLLGWSISETWLDLKKGIPLWAAQGARFLEHEHFLNGTEITKEKAAAFLEDEVKTLDVRYRPRPLNRDPMAQFYGLDMTNQNNQEIVRRCADFNTLKFSSADLEEEEERELAPEKEEERQVERPSRMEAAQHTVDRDLTRLAKTGQVSPTSKVIVPAFQALKTTSAGQMYDLPEFPTDLLVTQDFMNTIKVPSGSLEDPFIVDSFQRPVQWVVSVPGKTGLIQKLVIISPYEANDLLANIRKYAKVTLHLFAPRINTDYESLDQLQLWNDGRNFNPDSVPRSLIMQLNLFAGSLYLRSYEEYSELCDMLGLLRTNAREDQVVLPDGFITSSKGTWGLRDSPVPFLRALLMRVRREGEGLEKTHLGKILNGDSLKEADFRRDVHMTG